MHQVPIKLELTKKFHYRDRNSNVLAYKHIKAKGLADF